jgi:hypothetical protein
MKMATFHGLFWGIALIILGGGLMARFIYQIHFPWLRILVAFVFIYAGLWLLVRPRFEFLSNHLIIFSQGKLKYDTKQKDYTILFASGMLEIKDVEISSTQTIEINGIFSESVISIGNDVNFRLQADAAFASFYGPDGISTSFGSNTYQPPWFDREKPYLNIKTNVVFGNMRVVLDQS